jgi:hypothetical protein
MYDVWAYMYSLCCVLYSPSLTNLPYCHQLPPPTNEKTYPQHFLSSPQLSNNLTSRSRCRYRTLESRGKLLFGQHQVASLSMHLNLEQGPRRIERKIGQTRSDSTRPKQEDSIPTGAWLGPWVTCPGPVLLWSLSRNFQQQPHTDQV